MVTRCLWVGWLVVTLAGCATSPAMRAAERGDWSELRARIAQAERTGKLTNAEAADLARVVAKREIASAPARGAPPKSAVTRVLEVRACARELDGVLSSRMDVRDDAGAEAALARLDSGELGAGSVRSFASDANDAWRAVGTRGLNRKKDATARMAAMADGSPLVRRAAMRASADADDDAATDAEIEQLAGAARVDPEGIVRSEAVRALAVIGGERAVAKLRDLWTNGDDGVREEVAIAWSAPRVYAKGGAGPLGLLVAAEHGPAAIEGAAAAARQKGIDPALHASAVALLSRAVVSGSRRDRLHALAIASLGESDILAALRATARGDDREMEIAANARLLASPPDRAAATKALEARAGEDLGLLSAHARTALAAAGDVRIQAWIERDLTAPDVSMRLSAVSALAALGRSVRGAPVLADADPSVRTRAACAIIIGSRISSNR